MIWARAMWYAFNGDVINVSRGSQHHKIAAEFLHIWKFILRDKIHCLSSGSFDALSCGQRTRVTEASLALFLVAICRRLCLGRGRLCSRLCRTLLGGKKALSELVGGPTRRQFQGTQCCL
mmetsp:Transcript_106568/g.306522  ORF Transcript_106568/g.306522 Transcript_106568/m.306522 type:complete len:120 (-) Transcript_106568:120-479(-)